MLLNKQRNKMEEWELDHLMAVRQAWHTAKAGKKVCVVTRRELDWDTILGKYFEVVKQYVEKGLIYLRVENTLKPELEITVEDLENELVTMEMI